ncbi:unnamed protein product [Cunninghamella blakesleeana]
MDSSNSSACSNHLLSICSTIPSIVPFEIKPQHKFEINSVGTQSINSKNSNKNEDKTQIGSTSRLYPISKEQSIISIYSSTKNSIISISGTDSTEFESTISNNSLFKNQPKKDDCQYSLYTNVSENLLSSQSTLPIINNIKDYPSSTSSSIYSLGTRSLQDSHSLLATKKSTPILSINNSHNFNIHSLMKNINNNVINNINSPSFNNIQFENHHHNPIKRSFRCIENSNNNISTNSKIKKKSIKDLRCSITPSSQVYLSQPKSTFSIPMVQSQQSKNGSIHNKKIQKTSSQSNITKNIVTLMAIVEGCGVATEIGICVIHLPSNECQLYQISDIPTFTKTLHKIHLANPDKIIFFNSALSSTSKLIESVERHFSHITVISLPRKYFNGDEGLQYINYYGLEENTATLIPVIHSKYYCLTAISSLFKYLEDHNSWTFLHHTIKFIYQSGEGTMMIDAITAKNLELITSLDASTKSTKYTLFGAMNHTSTAMGARLLRSTILQPCTDLSTIQSRLDAVEALLKSESQFFKMTSYLKTLSDMDHIITSITKMPLPKNTNYNENDSLDRSFQEEIEADQQQSSSSPHLTETKINKIILLKSTLTTFHQISQLLLSVYSENTLLNRIGQILSSEKLNEFSQIINDTLNENVNYEKTSLGHRNQRCYASGINGLLDVARQIYTESVQNIYDMATTYCEETNLAIKLQFDTERKFHLVLNEDQFMNVQPLPPKFINITKKKKYILFSTLELLQKNSRVDESLSEIYMMIVTDILQTFRSGINVLYKSSESIAVLDLLMSFATGCMKSEKVRPEFTNTLAIKSGRHPILETTFIAKEDLISNDTYTSISSSFQIITGPNMSGKSTYVKQIALLTIMAHTGSFVPAEYASFQLCSQILSKLTNDTDQKVSNFMAEMQVINYILQNITNSSLVIIDELGRGTCQADAIGIATAICESIIHTHTNCFFVTHMIELAKWLELYPNVVNLQLSAKMPSALETNIYFSYMVKEGLTTCEDYGLALAKYIGLSSDVVENAEKIAEKLNMKNNKISTITITDVAEELKKSRYKYLLWFADKYLQITRSTNHQPMINTQLEEFRRYLIANSKN